MPCVNRSGCESRRKSSEKVFCDGDQESRRELSLLVSLLTHRPRILRLVTQIEEPNGVGSPGRPFSKKKTRKDGAHSQDPARGKNRARKAAANAGLQGPGKRPQGIETRIPFRREP